VKRGVIDTLRRGAENAIANWPLAAIRFAEVVMFGIIAVAAVILSLIPLLVHLGIVFRDVQSSEEVAAVIGTLLERWTLFIWFGTGVLVMLIVFVLIHSYVEAGCARVFVDADRAAGPAVAGPRQRYRLFSMDRWLAGAKEGGWKVFWIYNLAWSVAALILLIPLIPILVLLLVLRENPAAAAGIGCLGLIVFLIFAVVVGIIVGMWTNRAIADWAVQRGSARQALASGWRAVKSDPGRHLLAALAIFVVAMAGSSLFASFSMFAAFGDSVGHNMTFNLVTMPLRMVGSILSSAFSALIGSWYLATYAALAVESQP